MGQLQLTEAYPHKSAAGVCPVEFGDLTVLAGVNGAGKSHLLEAMASGAVRVARDGDLIDSSRILLYDWTTFRVQKTGEVSEAELQQQAANHWRNLQNQIAGGKVKSTVDGVRQRWSDIKDPDLLGAPLLTLFEAGDPRMGELEELRRACRAALAENLNDELRQIVTQVESFTGGLVFECDRRTFVDSAMIGRLAVDPLQQRIAGLFAAYDSILYRNEANRALAAEGRVDLPFVSEDEFERRHGPPPWDVVNSLLVDLGLDFQIPGPKLGSGAHSADLVHQTDGVPVSFDDLSSGEKVLLALAITLYGTIEDRHRVSLPAVLLLDEVDAPLHPAMIRTYLRTVEDVLVANGVAVVLSTHSPSTVALAPEDSVWLMSKDKPRLEHVSNRRALSHLTAGVTALTVRFEDRRQIFVESGYDAEIYTRVLDAIRPHLQAEFGLHFLAPSKSKGVNGSSVVIDTVQRFRDAGIDTAFGVVDWDLKNESSANVFVLGAGHRYTIENYLFDPLLMAALVIRLKKAHTVSGLEDILPTDVGTYRGLLGADEGVLQAVVEAMVSAGGWVSTGESERCLLIGGNTIELTTDFCRAQGHTLYEAWATGVPALQRYQDEKALREAIVTLVVPEVPELISQDLLDLMAALAR